jgi:hypothetical protein
MTHSAMAAQPDASPPNAALAPSDSLSLAVVVVEAPTGQGVRGAGSPMTLAKRPAP